MVRQYKTAVDGALPPRAAHHHPAGGEGSRLTSETPQPCRGLRRGRRDDERTYKFLFLCDAAGIDCFWKRDARLAVGSIKPLDGTVSIHRPDRVIDACNYPLRL